MVRAYTQWLMLPVNLALHSCSFCSLIFALSCVFDSCRGRCWHNTSPNLCAHPGAPHCLLLSFWQIMVKQCAHVCWAQYLTAPDSQFNIPHTQHMSAYQQTRPWALALFRPYPGFHDACNNQQWVYELCPKNKSLFIQLNTNQRQNNRFLLAHRGSKGFGRVTQQ